MQRFGEDTDDLLADLAQALDTTLRRGRIQDVPDQLRDTDVRKTRSAQGCFSSPLTAERFYTRMRYTGRYGRHARGRSTVCADV
jgi:hypothetical protein